jgi:predicted dehydrogenase
MQTHQFGFGRRAFLAVAGGIGVSACAQAKRRIPVGLLGINHAHAFEKARILGQSPDWEFLGVAGGDEEARRRFAAAGMKVIASGELWERAEVVVVESHVRDLARLARMALDHGKHVHVEKPIGENGPEVVDLIDRSGTSARLLQVGYMWRFHPAINEALRAAREGWLGKVFQLRGAIHTTVTKERRPEWARFRGGAMFELGCHLIDPMVRLLGRPKNVTPILRRHGDVDDALMDNNLAVLEWDGALGIVTNSALQPGAGEHRSFEVLGTNGTAVVRPIEPGALTIHLSKDVGPYKAGANVVKLEPYQRYVGDFAELAAAVRGERKLGVTPKEEMLVHDAILKASGMRGGLQ